MKNLYKKGFSNIDRENNQWKVFVIKWYDKILDNALKYCPKTCEIINKCSDIRAAMFSILEPGKYIPLHKGPFVGCLRYHLGIKIPKDYKNCYIEVNDERFYWQEGESLVFDDTYKHLVYNNTNEPRIILFLDIERPIKYLKSVTKILLNNAKIISFVKGINDKSEEIKELFTNNLIHY
jgi:beta-hydroxylase